MNWSIWIRQIHRWLSIIFTAVVVAIFVMLGIGREPAQWVYFVPLLPLALLLFSGLYLFALPYVARWRGRRTGAQASASWPPEGLFSPAGKEAEREEGTS